jgi:hypothetical protein
LRATYGLKPVPFKAAPDQNRGILRTALAWLLVLLAGLTASAQSPTAPSAQTPASPPAQSPAAPSTAAQSSAAPARLSGELILNGPWRFQVGDDARWAEPAFDDSEWAAVTLDASLTDQGQPKYSGYAWYRLRMDAGQSSTPTGAEAGTLPVFIAEPSPYGQMAIYVDGVEAAHTRGMTAQPASYVSLPMETTLPPGPHTIAIRTWAGPNTTVARGLLMRAELGSEDTARDRRELAEARLWNHEGISVLVVGFLFFCVAGLGLVLFFAQRSHSEYLWLALLCLAVGLVSVSDTAYILRWVPNEISTLAGRWLSHIFMAVTLEFVLRFTASGFRRTVRAVQVIALALPACFWLMPRKAYGTLSVAAELVFVTLVCVMLLGGWRRGRREAGVMLVPFFFAAVADSADTVLSYLAWQGWIGSGDTARELSLGPIRISISATSYLVFLAGLAAIILYRFIRVSQDEQRSSAEIAAARSVQAMLIPTKLPSNQHFMLESAYLPVNGVGGDFFQVLPLADESLLLVVGDVSGKGLQAAMSSSTLVGALRNELAHDPATILDHLNRVLLGAGKDAGTNFATCLCARIHPDGRMVLANAGHLSPYRDGREMEMLPSLPLGVIAEAGYSQTSYQLNRGDRLVFLSDGVVEAINAQGEIFGFERTQQVSNEPALYISQTAKHFGQTDDITVISLYLASRRAPERG